MKVACLLITHLRTKVEMRRHPDLKSTPAVIVGRSRGRSMVVDSTPYTSGVSPGMTLEEALSIRPETLVLEADEPHYRRVVAQVLASLQGIPTLGEGSPRAAPNCILGSRNAPFCGRPSRDCR